jgi:hypothetical protein
MPKVIVFRGIINIGHKEDSTFTKEAPMGKKGNDKAGKKKMTKKEKKQASHLKLVQGKGGGSKSNDQGLDENYKKSA